MKITNKIVLLAWQYKLPDVYPTNCRIVLVGKQQLTVSYHDDHNASGMWLYDEEDSIFILLSVELFEERLITFFIKYRS